MSNRFSRAQGEPDPDVRKRVRSPEDTVAGCEALAASDLARAAATDTENGRLKLQHSAASWQKRADLLQRLQNSFNKREALDQAESDRAVGRPEAGL